MSKITAKIANPRSRDVENEVLLTVKTLNISDFLHEKPVTATKRKGLNPLAAFNKLFLKAVTQ